jgi:hypothetical protein
MNVGTVVIDASVGELFRLLEGEPLHALKVLTEGGRERFFELLFCGFKNEGLHISPTCKFSTTPRASDGAIVGSFVWDRGFIAAALLTTQRELGLA